MTLAAASAHSSGFLLARSIGGTALVVAFVAMVMRVPVKREGAIARGEPPRELGLSGFRPATSKGWWFPAWFVKTAAGWEKVDRLLVIVASTAAVVAVGSIVVVAALGLN